ncbi:MULTISPECIES: RluA family pseudouridine synthase [Chromobacterium]|uniref:Pseudouridine synthase n=1 Tax=Chromobacterium aquaticum TaxID=467180 RepID=A0ABV8ZTC6_9NEIS|nr:MULTISPECIES: RluA family pseudouridine synthase [Chromobacterium]KMN36220.1 pseudouridine synthase [Chromobacterium sp. LK1]MCD5362203.1 RluA family pseudouridine synthase [Chromobacterium aquaticum]
MTDIRKDSVSFVQVDDSDAGQRIDNYLVRLLKGVPKSHIYRILRSGEVRVNKGRIDAAYRVQAGDELRIPPIRVAERAEKNVPAATFPVVYEDNALLVIDKPAGVAVHGGSGVSFGVIEQLRQAHPDWRYLELVHRLDRETSGLLMLAKKRSALTKLHDMMRANVPDKRYLALGIGQWPDDARQVKLPLFKFHTADGERRVRVSDAENGQYAHTNFAIKERFAEFTLVEAHLRTGRTHQIRVHMQANGCAIAGDEKYGDFALNKELAKRGLKRMFLHARSLSLPHPLTGEPLKLEAPLPAELERFLKSLRS